MNRNQAGFPWVPKALLALASGCLGGAGVGCVAALAGSVMPITWRAAAWVLFAIVLIPVGFVPSLRMPEIGKETSQRLLDAGPVWWPILNGGLLGVAVTTRLAFPLWYVAPLVSFMLGDWPLGLLIGALYGAARLTTIVGLAWRTRVDAPGLVCDFALGQRKLADRACRAMLLLAALFILGTVGP